MNTLKHGSSHEIPIRNSSSPQMPPPKLKNFSVRRSGKSAQRPRVMTNPASRVLRPYLLCFVTYLPRHECKQVRNQLVSTLPPPHPYLQCASQDETNPTKIESSTCSSDSKFSDNEDMFHPRSRTAIACKLGTAIVLLVHSIFGCSLAHGCCIGHASQGPSLAKFHSGSRFSCQHSKNSQQPKQSAVPASCEHEHNSHQPVDNDYSQPEEDVSADESKFTESLRRGLQSGTQRLCDAALASDSATQLGSKTTQQGRSPSCQTPARSCDPLQRPSSHHTPVCCTTLNCSFITATTKSSIIEIGRLFPVVRSTISPSLHSKPLAATLLPLTTSSSALTSKFLCVTQCSWQV